MYNEPNYSEDILCPVPDTNDLRLLYEGIPVIDSRRSALNEVNKWITIFRGESKITHNKRSKDLNRRKENLWDREILVDDSIFSPQIERAIKTSEFILGLPENWDEEGSPKYLKETWNAATQFVRKTALLYKKEVGKWINAPKITPGPDGSIDVRWKNSKRSILVNFPANSITPADFYGSDKQIDVIKGTLNLSSQNHWILQWLNR